MDLVTKKYFIYRAMTTRGKNMHLVVSGKEVYVTIISTEGEIKVYELSLLLQKFEDSEIVSDD